MTKLDLKVNFHIVEELFPDDNCATHVWLSERAGDGLSKFVASLEGKRFVKKLKHYAVNGFADHEGGKGKPIRYEGDGVYRVGHDSTLFRIIGFYAVGKKEYIGIDYFEKSGQSLNASQRKRIKGVAKVKKSRGWRKRTK